MQGGYLRRLLAGGAAYQSASLLSAALALITLPLYTRELSPADFGVAETLLVAIILTSIILRVGLGEAFVRRWHEQPDEAAQARLAQLVLGVVLVVSTLVACAAVFAAEPLSRLLIARSDPTLTVIAIGGLWAFTNLEMAYALLRVREARRTYLAASLANVALTVTLTVSLVVVADHGAAGYLAGNYAASAVVLLVIWASQAKALFARNGPPIALAPLLRFGVPLVPAEAMVFALNVVDRAYLVRTQGAAIAGIYALAVKLATIVIVAVRAFGLAWPPLAYSVEDEDAARTLYATVCTWYVACVGAVVVALAVLDPWLVRLLAGPAFGGASGVVGWVALGWALYGLYLLLVTISGRARVTLRTLPAAALGLVVNLAVLVMLADELGAQGAALALCAAYVVMISVLYLLTRRAFAVPFDWRRLAHAAAILVAAAAVGTLVLPGDGALALLGRLAVVGSVPLAFALTGFLTVGERAIVRSAARRGVSRGSQA